MASLTRTGGRFGISSRPEGDQPTLSTVLHQVIGPSVSQEYSRRLVAEAGRLRCSRIRIERLRRHPCLRATFNDKPICVVFAGTSGDQYFGCRKAIADLRRAVRKIAGGPTPKNRASLLLVRKRRRRQPRRKTAMACKSPRMAGDATPTRLDRDPWQDLAHFREDLIQELFFPGPTQSNPVDGRHD